MSGATDRIGVVVTMGGPRELERGEAIRAAALTARQLHAMQRNVIYSFTA